MDKVGVDARSSISAFSMYRYDASYAVEVQRAHPSRFRIVKPVDPTIPVWLTSSPTEEDTGHGGFASCLPKDAKRDPGDPASTGSHRGRRSTRLSGQPGLTMPNRLGWAAALPRHSWRHSGTSKRRR